METSLGAESFRALLTRVARNNDCSRDAYLQACEVTMELLGRGFTWLNTGTKKELVEARDFIRTIEHQQGLKIGCPEEFAFRMGYIDREELLAIAEPILGNSYGRYLRSIVEEFNNGQKTR